MTSPGPDPSPGFGTSPAEEHKPFAAPDAGYTPAYPGAVPPETSPEAAPPGVYPPATPYAGTPYPGTAYPGTAYPGTAYPGTSYPGTYPAGTAPGSAPGYPPPPGGYAGYGTSPYYPGYQGAARTNGLAIASMVVSLVGLPLLLCYGISGLLGVVGAVLGHVARRQIRASGEAGEGMALTGIIIGWITFGVGVLVVAAIVVAFIGIASTAQTDPTLFQLVG